MVKYHPVFKKLDIVKVHVSLDPKVDAKDGIPIHGFLHATHNAFANHQSLEIRPDDIWLLVLQAITSIEEGTGFLGKAFKFPKKKKTLLVTGMDKSPSKMGEKDWTEVFLEFRKQIQAGTPKELHNLVKMKFSTTTTDDHVTFAISLMGMMKNYFKYQMDTLCGIPNILIRGKEEDYQKIVAVLETLGNSKALDIKWWTDAVVGMVDQFVHAFQEDIDPNFWSSIYKYRGALGSGGKPTISGWITAFFPYIQGKKRYCDWSCYSAGRYDECRINPSFLPYGISCVPVDWNYGGNELKFSFYAGFIGFGSNRSGGLDMLHPNMGWVVSKGYGEDPGKKVKTKKEEAYDRIQEIFAQNESEMKEEGLLKELEEDKDVEMNDTLTRPITDIRNGNPIQSRLKAIKVDMPKEEFEKSVKDIHNGSKTRNSTFERMIKKSNNITEDEINTLVDQFKGKEGIEMVVERVTKNDRKRKRDSDDDKDVEMSDVKGVVTGNDAKGGSDAIIIQPTRVIKVKMPEEEMDRALKDMEKGGETRISAFEKIVKKSINLTEDETKTVIDEFRGRVKDREEESKNDRKRKRDLDDDNGGEDERDIKKRKTE